MTKIKFENKELYNFSAHSNNPYKFVDQLPQPKNNSSTFSLKSPQKTKIYRQGDILIKKVKFLPSDKTPKKENIIAEGEMTGHAHLLNDGALYEVLNSESLYIKANENTIITHDEHLPIKLESGNYKVVRQREYLGEGLNNRIVAD